MEQPFCFLTCEVWNNSTFQSLGSHCVWERGVNPLIILFLAKICEGCRERETNTGASPVSSLAELVSVLWWRLGLTLDVVIKHTIKHISEAIRAGIVTGWQSREHRRCVWLFYCSGTSLTATKTHFKNEKTALQEAQEHQLHAQPMGWANGGHLWGALRPLL